MSGWATAISRRSRRRERSDGQLHRLQQQQRPVLSSARGLRDRDTHLHPGRQRQRLRNRFGPDPRQRRYHQRWCRHLGRPDLHHHRERGQRRPELHEGRRPDRERGRRSPERVRMGHGDLGRSRQRERSDGQLRGLQQQRRSVLGSARGCRERDPHLHPGRQRQRLRDRLGPDPRQRRHRQRWGRHVCRPDLHDHRDRGQRRSELHEGRRPDRERGRRSPERLRMGHRDLGRSCQRERSDGQLPRFQRQQRPVLGSAGGLLDRDPHLHPGRECQRLGDRLGPDPRQRRHRQRWRRHLSRARPSPSP